MNRKVVWGLAAALPSFALAQGDVKKDAKELKRDERNLRRISGGRRR
jgi:hypothetical protein